MFWLETVHVTKHITTILYITDILNRFLYREHKNNCLMKLNPTKPFTEIICEAMMSFHISRFYKKFPEWKRAP